MRAKSPSIDRICLVLRRNKSLRGGGGGFQRCKVSKTFGRLSGFNPAFRFASSFGDSTSLKIKNVIVSRVLPTTSNEQTANASILESLLDGALWFTAEI